MGEFISIVSSICLSIDTPTVTTDIYDCKHMWVGASCKICNVNYIIIGEKYERSNFRKEVFIYHGLDNKSREA